MSLVTVKSILIALFVSILGGSLFRLLHIPLPWMLGPLTGIMLYNLFFKQLKLVIYWPLSFRNAGLIILGYMMGISFTRDAAQQILKQLPSMLLATVIIIICSLILGFIISRRTGINLPTSIIGSIPGGLTQMVVLCEEINDADITAVTFIQTIRLLTVVFMVPFLSLHLLSDSPEQIVSLSILNINELASAFSPGNILIFVFTVLIITWISVRISLPTPYLVGPLIGAAVLVLSGLQAPPVPSLLIIIAQLAVGAYMGISMNIVSLKNWQKLLPYSIGFGLGIVFISLAIGYLLTCYYPLKLITAFLSTAPGGMTEMGVTAVAAHADLSMVTAYQMFRVFFILFVVPPLLKWCLPKMDTTY